MATCKNCLSEKVCRYNDGVNLYCKEDYECPHFKSTADVVEVVRCRECDVPHNKWLGCPNLNGMIPPPDFYCAKGKRKAKNADRDGEPFGNLHNAFVERSKK